MTKTGKPRPYGKWPIVIIVLLLIALLFCCCQKKKPKIFTLNSFAYDMNGELVQVPFSKLIIEDENGEINAHGDVERIPKKPDTEDGKPVKGITEYMDGKRRNLIKECFSKTDYSAEVPHLSTISLSEDDITITVLNFDDKGRLESYDLVDPTDGVGLPKFITDITSNSQLGNYYAIQTALSGLNRVKVTPNVPGNIIKPRLLSQADADKTPFYKPFDAGFTGGANGHVIFYVLADENLQFNRALPVIAHAPASNIGELYSPFREYEIEPAYPSPLTALEVQVLHFMRGGTMMKGMKPDVDGEIPCSYPYDLGVIAIGQDIGIQDTPLLIDPEVKSKGPRP